MDIVSLKQAKKNFDDNKIIGVKIPLKLNPFDVVDGKKNKLPKIDTYAKLFIKKEENINKPFQMVLRDFLVISQEPSTSKHNLPIFALLLIEETEISKFALRCEADNHIKFDHRSNIAKQYYDSVMATLSCLRRSFDSFVKYFYGVGSVIEKDLLIDLLSVPLLDMSEFENEVVGDDEGLDEEEIDDEEDEDEDESDDEDPRDEYFVLDHANGWGFNSRENNPVPYLPFKIKAVFSPATQETIHNSKANSSSYDPCDFDLSDEIFDYHSKNLDLSIEFNEIDITITDYDFFLDITGFPDSKRVIGTIEYLVEEQSQ